MNVELISSDEDDLAVDPLLGQVPRIDVLAELELHRFGLH